MGDWEPDGFLESYFEDRVNGGIDVDEWDDGYDPFADDDYEEDDEW